MQKLIATPAYDTLFGSASVLENVFNGKRARGSIDAFANILGGLSLLSGLLLGAVWFALQSL